MAQIILSGSKYAICRANIPIAATAKMRVSIMGTASTKTLPAGANTGQGVMVIDLFVWDAQTVPGRAMHVRIFFDDMQQGRASNCNRS